MKKINKKKEEWTVEKVKKELKWIKSMITYHGKSIKYFEELKETFLWKLKQLQRLSQ